MRLYQTDIPEKKYNYEKSERSRSSKPMVLIADDNPMNRSMLSDILGDEFEIIEAADGIHAFNLIKHDEEKLELLMLDMMMPKMDGFDILVSMKKLRPAVNIPVIMIASESSPSYLKRAFDLGITDYVSWPFDVTVVRNRVNNAIMLHASKRRILNFFSGRIYDAQKNSQQIINMLSHLIEHRDLEGDDHILRVNVVTRLLLERLNQRRAWCHLTNESIALITMASALHDIGKIYVPNRILKKPGKLTERELAMAKSHAAAGAELAEKFLSKQNQELAGIVYGICRWHHERYDGGGYPDGLKGDNIPIAAQVVALADVYGSLTSIRVYGKKYTHRAALEMILNGECGHFNPELLECLREIAYRIPKEISNRAMGGSDVQDAQEILLKMRDGELTASNRTLQLLELERTKYQFFASMSDEIQFEYTSSPPMLTLSDWGAERLGVNAIIMNPCEDQKLISILGEDTIQAVNALIKKATPNQPVFQYEGRVNIGGELRWHRIICRRMWTSDEASQHMVSVIGKLLDIHEDHVQMVELKRMAYYDALTGLLNHANARLKIQARLSSKADARFALAIFDLDYFKEANDNFGHAFGDRVLQYVAGRLSGAIRSDDIAARVGGDEFMIFLEYKMGLENIVQRILGTLSGEFQGFSISISMGIAMTEVVGTDYDTLFQCADQALYSVKRSKRGTFRFYDESLKDMLSVISPIDADQEE